MCWQKIDEVNAVSWIRSRLYSGISLVELLVSLTIASLFVFIIGRFYTENYHAHIKQKTLFELQKNSHQLLNYIQQHSQHIGYQGEFRKGSNFEFFKLNGHSAEIIQPSCLIFFYDLNGDGCLGQRTRTNSCINEHLNNTRNVAKEVFGFKTNRKELYIYEDSNISKCSEMECGKLLSSCEQGKWRKLTDKNNYTIENLTFSWTIPQKLLKTELTLQSAKSPQIRYHTTGYSYILN